MKTTCENCEKEFKLDFETIYIGTEKEAPHENVVVIKCPHCERRHEF